MYCHHARLMKIKIKYIYLFPRNFQFYLGLKFHLTHFSGILKDKTMNDKFIYSSYYDTQNYLSCLWKLLMEKFVQPNQDLLNVIKVFSHTREGVLKLWGQV